MSRPRYYTFNPPRASSLAVDMCHSPRSDLLTLIFRHLDTLCIRLRCSEPESRPAGFLFPFDSCFKNCIPFSSPPPLLFGPASAFDLFPFFSPCSHSIARASHSVYVLSCIVRFRHLTCSFLPVEVHSFPPLRHFLPAARPSALRISIILPSTILPQHSCPTPLPNTRAYPLSPQKRKAFDVFTLLPPPSPDRGGELSGS